MTGKNKHPRLIRWLIMLAISITLITYWYEERNPSQELLAKARVSETLKDAESARWRNLRPGTHDFYCGEVNSKNSFGAYDGFRRFYTRPGKTRIENGEEGELGETIYAAVCPPEPEFK